MKIYLDYTLALKEEAIVDRKEYMTKYLAKNGELLKGAPLLINIEGTCVLASKLVDLTKSKFHKEKVNEYLVSLKQKDPNVFLPKDLTFAWRR